MGNNFLNNTPKSLCHPPTPHKLAPPPGSLDSLEPESLLSLKPSRSTWTPLSETTRRSSSSMEISSELDSTRVSDSLLKTELKTLEESLKYLSFSACPDASYSSLSSALTPRTETSPRHSTEMPASSSSNATSLPPSRFAKVVMSRDSTRRLELESSPTSLVSLTLMRNPRTVTSTSTLVKSHL